MKLKRFFAKVVENTKKAILKTRCGFHAAICRMLFPFGVKSITSETWQFEACKTFTTSKKRVKVLHAPTGSGKSMVLMQEGIRQLKSNPKSKLILATDSLNLVEQFGKEKFYLLPNNTQTTCIALSLIALIIAPFQDNIIAWGLATLAVTILAYIKLTHKVITWNPAYQLNGTGQHINTLIQFLNNSEAKTLDERILVCTHATFSRTIPDLPPEQYQNVTTIIDECDFARCLSVTAGVDANRLGHALNLIYAWTENTIYCATATLTRTDGGSCIPSSYVHNNAILIDYDNTTIYERFKHEHIQRAKLNIQFEMDGIRGANRLRRSLSKRFDIGEMTKTIVYIPAISSKRRSANGHPSMKYDYRDYVMQAISGYTKSSDWYAKSVVGRNEVFTTIKRADGREFVVIDRVEETGQQQRLRDALLRDYRTKVKPIPENLVVIALGKCIRGWDLACMERVINLGQDKSLSKVEQKLGRILRYWHEKQDALFVQYNICPRTRHDERQFRRSSEILFTAYLGIGGHTPTIRRLLSGGRIGGRPAGTVMAECIRNIVTGNIDPNSINEHIQAELAKAIGHDFIVRSVKITPNQLKIMQEIYEESINFNNPDLIHEFNSGVNSCKGRLIETYKKLTFRDRNAHNQFIHPSEQDLRNRGMAYYIPIRRLWCKGFRTLFVNNNAPSLLLAQKDGVTVQQILDKEAVAAITGTKIYQDYIRRGKTLSQFLIRNGLNELNERLQVLA